MVSPPPPPPPPTRWCVHVYGGDVVQVCDLHEGLVEVVKLQDAGQQEETRDDDTGEEFGEGKRLQADRCKSTGDRRAPIMTAGQARFILRHV